MAMQAGKMSQNIQLQAVAQGLTFVSIDAVEGADVRRVARIPRNYEPLYVAIVGYPASQTAGDGGAAGRAPAGPKGPAGRSSHGIPG